MNHTSTDISLIKKAISERYKRLNTRNRSPSLEYISPDELRIIFEPYAKDKKILETLSDEDVIELYSQFLEVAKDDVKDGKPCELYLPDMQ